MLMSSHTGKLFIIYIYAVLLIDGSNIRQAILVNSLTNHQKARFISFIYKRFFGQSLKENLLIAGRNVSRKLLFRKLNTNRFIWILGISILDYALFLFYYL